MRIHWPDHGNNCLKCDWLSCDWGLGLIGRGSCPGLWFWSDCPEYKYEYEKWKNGEYNWVLDIIKRIGKINPALKIRIDRLQGQIDLIDRKYLPGTRFYYDSKNRWYYDYLELRKELVDIRAGLIYEATC